MPLPFIIYLLKKISICIVLSFHGGIIFEYAMFLIKLNDEIAMEAGKDHYDRFTITFLCLHLITYCCFFTFLGDYFFFDNYFLNNWTYEPLKNFINFFLSPNPINPPEEIIKNQISNMDNNSTQLEKDLENKDNIEAAKTSNINSYLFIGLIIIWAFIWPNSAGR